MRLDLHQQTLKDRLKRLNEIGVALSAEHDLTTLLERILQEARRFTRADAGTLYLVKGDHLIFEIAQNDSLENFANGRWGKGDIPPVAINEESASGYVAMTGETLNIADVYVEQEHRFESPKNYDRMTGYRTRSMLVAPMKDHENRIIGVLQLLNAVDPETGETGPFLQEEEALIQSLASQAAMVINNVRLIEETRRLHHQNELILLTAGEGIFGLDMDGRFTFANPATATMLGYRVEELISHSHHELFHHSKADGNPYPEEDCPIHATLRRKILQRKEDEVFWRKDGTSFPVEYVVTPMREGEEVVGAVVVFSDISERRQAEEERRTLERQLVHSERMASIGVVTAGIVHNLKNSLIGILSYGELLQLQHPDIADIEQIISAAQEMNQIIEDILAKSRQKKITEKVDLNVLIGREVDFLQADQIFKHEVATDIHLTETLPAIECVYTDFSQAVGSLLRNAIDAMYGREKKKLTVVTALESEHVIVEITDTGCGIPEADIPHLFEPFFTTKSPAAESDEPVGTGLGLYMLQRLLEPYGVKVEVESTVEVGTTFRLKIPR